MSTMYGIAPLLVPLFLVLAPAPVLAEDDAGTRKYEEERLLAAEQSEDPAVEAYRKAIAPVLDTVMGTALLHCSRRELYSRRAIPDLVLAIDGGGTVTGVTVKVVNRMGVCYSEFVTGLTLPPPPTAPLRLALEQERER